MDFNSVREDEFYIYSENQKPKKKHRFYHNHRIWPGNLVHLGFLEERRWKMRNYVDQQFHKIEEKHRPLEEIIKLTGGITGSAKISKKNTRLISVLPSTNKYRAYSINYNANQELQHDNEFVQKCVDLENYARALSYRIEVFNKALLEAIVIKHNVYDDSVFKRPEIPVYLNNRLYIIFKSTEPIFLYLPEQPMISKHNDPETIFPKANI